MAMFMSKLQSLISDRDFDQFAPELGKIVARARTALKSNYFLWIICEEKAKEGNKIKLKVKLKAIKQNVQSNLTPLAH